MHKGCGFDPQSGHIQEATNEYINNWNNVSLSKVSFKILKPQHCSLNGKETLNINTVPLINTSYITLQNNKFTQAFFPKLGGKVYPYCIFQVVLHYLKKKKKGR